MNRWLLSLAVSLVALAACTLPLLARVMIIARPGPERIVNSDTIVVGKVVGLEPEDVMVANTAYRIAVVQIKEAIRGAKDAKSVRVGFMPTPPAGGKLPIRPGFRSVQLQVGQEGLFLLTKHPQEKFFTLGGPIGYFISSDNNANYEKDLNAVKGIIKVTVDPQAALKSKDAEERLLAASVLIEKYRTFRGPGQSKQEPIDAAESKLILLALADADWKTPPAFGGFRPNPAMLFNRLGIAQPDGWMPPPGSNVQDLMPTWLRDHAEKYQIKRMVAADTK